MTDEPRPYRMKRRAVSQQETRRRITESAVHLHGTLGPSRTSLSAIAEHAGVRRSTLYRHFPDDAAVFDACTAHWASANPLPDISAWAALVDPEQRLRVGLTEIYSFYERTEAMLENLFRDETTMPMVSERFAAFRGYFAAGHDALMAGRKLRGSAKRRAHAAVGHAIAFSTWKSLVREQGLSGATAVGLMVEFVSVAVRR